jgi:hypothetical protein
MDGANDSGWNGQMISDGIPKAFHDARPRRNIDMVSFQSILGSDHPVQEINFSRPEKKRPDDWARLIEGQKRNRKHMMIEKKDAVQI